MIYGVKPYKKFKNYNVFTKKTEHVKLNKPNKFLRKNKIYGSINKLDTN